MGLIGKFFSKASGLADKAAGFIGKIHSFKERAKEAYEKKAPSLLKGVVEAVMNTTPIGDYAKKAESWLDAAHAKSRQVANTFKEIEKTGRPAHEVAARIMASPAQKAPEPERMAELRQE